MKKNSKRILVAVFSAVFLMTVLISGLTMSVSAETYTKMLYDGEALPTTGEEGTYSIDSATKTEGDSSLKIVQSTDGGYAFSTTLAASVPAADYEYLKLDVWVTHVWQTAACWEINVSLDGGTNTVNCGMSVGYFGNGNTGTFTTAPGEWATITIPMSAFEGTETITGFSIEQPYVNEGNWAQIQGLDTLYIDNVRLETSKKPTEPETEAPVTEAPVTETPVTDVPATDAPVTDTSTETDAPSAPDTGDSFVIPAILIAAASVAAVTLLGKKHVKQ